MKQEIHDNKYKHMYNKILKDNVDTFKRRNDIMRGGGNMQQMMKQMQMQKNDKNKKIKRKNAL